MIVVSMRLDIFELHVFENATETLADRTSTKHDLRFRFNEEVRDLLTELIVATVAGDLSIVQVKTLCSCCVLSLFRTRTHFFALWFHQRSRIPKDMVPHC